MTTKTNATNDAPDDTPRLKALGQAVRLLYTASLQGHADHWDREQTRGANCPACQFANRQREAAVEILGYVPEPLYVTERTTSGGQ